MHCTNHSSYTVPPVPSRQNLADSVGNSQGLWLLVEGIQAEIWVVSGTRIHMEIQRNFLIGVKMRGKFPQTCKYFTSPKNDIKSSLGYFHITGTLPMSLKCIVKFLREAQRKFLRRNIPRDSTGKWGRNIHTKNSPLFPLNFLREIMRTFPQGWFPEIPP